MRLTLILLFSILLLPFCALSQTEQDTVRFYKLEAAGSVSKVVEKVKMEIQKRRLTIFGITDHGAAAAQVNLELSPSVLITFGSPATGSLLMQADPRMGAELPLRFLVWEEDKRTYIGYVNPLTWLEEYTLAGQEDVVNRISQVMGGIMIHAAQ